MSYDLYFKKRNGSLTLQEFMEYFEERKNYALHGEKNCPRAWYQNDNTGVYFSFDYVDIDDEEIEDDEEPQRDIEFNINSFRPHFFGLEAALELTELCKQFPLEVLNPQIDERWRTYNSNLFVNNWQQHNRAKIRHQNFMTHGFVAN